MSHPTPDPPFESQPQGISLDELAQAFAQVMGGEPRRPAEEQVSPAAGGAAEASATQDGAGETTIAQGDAGEMPASTAAAIESAPGDEACPISPRTILEAMLFVGNRENRPLSPERVAELMRDVATDEIPTIVDDLNNRYAAQGAAYRIVGEGGGYRLSLCPELHSLRDRFYGRIREARLSQAAIDVPGAGGLSTARHRRQDRPSAWQAEQPCPGPSGASGAVAG